jgi:hypothetical protein
MAKSKTKKIDLPVAMSFKGKVYPKGTNVEVPEDFPEGKLDRLREEQEKLATGAPSDPPENRIEVYTTEELDGMTKAKLIELAEANPSVTVARADGGDGDPTKDDYVAALAAANIRKG